MTDVEKFRDKEYLKKEIAEFSEFIIRNVDFQKTNINVHLAARLQPDYPRIFFTLFTISRLIKNNFLQEEVNLSKKNFVNLLWKIYEKVLETKTKDPLHRDHYRYVELYALRALKQIGECESVEFSKILEDFKIGDYADIVAYPVLTYLFVSTYLECDLKSRYPYSESVFYESLKVFDYWMNSSHGQDYLPFHFSEISHWKYLPDKLGYPENIFDDLAAQADEKINNNWKNYLERKLSTSGVAKCLEYFSRIYLNSSGNQGADSKLKMHEFFTFLENRKMDEYKDYCNPNYLSIKKVYREDENTQYVCIDVNSHVIHALLNIYENI